MQHLREKLWCHSYMAKSLGSSLPISHLTDLGLFFLMADGFVANNNTKSLHAGKNYFSIFSCLIERLYNEKELLISLDILQSAIYMKCD